MEKREANFQNFENREQNKEDILQKKQEELENSVIEVFKKEEKEKDFSPKNLEKILDFAKKENLNLASEKIINFLGDYFQDNIANKEKIDYLLNFSETSDLPIDKIVESSLKISLSKDMIYRSQKIIDFLKENNIQTNLESVFFESIENKLSDGKIREAEETLFLAKTKEIPVEFSGEKLDKITNALKEGAIKLFEEGNTKYLNKLINFSIEEKISVDFSREQYKMAAHNGFKKLLWQGLFDEAKNFHQFLEQRNIDIDLQNKDIGFAAEYGLILQIQDSEKNDDKLYFDKIKNSISFYESKNIPINLSNVFSNALKELLVQGKIDTVKKVISFTERENKELLLDLDSVAKESLKKAILNNWYYVANTIINFIKEKDLKVDIDTIIRDALVEFSENGQIAYLNNLLELCQKQNIKAEIDDNLIISGIKNFKIQEWKDVRLLMNFLIKEKNSLSKETKEAFILLLNQKMPEFVPKRRTQFEAETVFLQINFKDFLNNFLGQENKLNQLFIKLLSESLPLTKVDFVNKLRNDAAILNQLNQRLEPIRDIIHNYPSQKNFELIKIINEIFNEKNKKEKEEKYKKFQEFWTKNYSILGPDFQLYSLDDLEKFSQYEDIRKTFLQLQDDLETIWQEKPFDQEEIQNALQTLPLDLKEKIGQIEKDKDNTKIAIDIGNLRSSLASILTSKDTKNKEKLYLLDRYLEGIGYKSYSEYLNSFDKITKNNFFESLEVLKSIFKSMEADFFVNKEIKEVINAINSFEFKDEKDLPKLKFYVESLLENLSIFLENQRQEFYKIVEKAFPEKSLKEKEELFSALFRNKSIQFADDLAMKINRYLENNKVVSEQSLKEIKKLKDFRKENFGD